MVSPGVSYLITSIVPKLVTPPATLYALFELLKHLGHGDAIPRSLTTKASFAGLSLSSIVAYAVLKVWYTNVVNWRERRALGAKSVPVVKGKWPGNVDVMLKMVHAFHNDYVAQIFEDWSQEYGTVFNIRMLWDDMVSRDETRWVMRG